jgi:two-component sensor histidine kinase
MPTSEGWADDFSEDELRRSEERFRALATTGAVIVYRMSADWRFLYQLSGREFLSDVAEPIENWAETFLLPEDRPAVFAAVEHAMRTKSPFELEHRVRVARGGTGWVLSRAVPILGDDGEIVEWLGAGTDVTAKRVAIDKLRDSEAQLAAAVEALPVAIAVLSASGEFTLANQAMDRFLPTKRMPYNDHERAWRWQAWNADGSRVDLSEYPGARAFRGERVVPGMEMLYRQDDGAQVWTTVSTVPMHDVDGNVSGIVTVINDIDSLKRNAQALEASKAELSVAHERQTTLLAELQHRVRNTLSVIRSIVRRSVASASDVEDFAAHLDGRIGAFARVQAAVTRDPEAGIDLGLIVADELNAAAAHEGDGVSIKGPDIRLQPKAAETMALVVHELVTNAIKHGALAGEKGRVKVTWAVEPGEPSILCFVWKESGVAVSTRRPPRRGFGTELLERTLTYDLKAEVDWKLEPHGLNCSIRLPMNERLVR